MNEALPPEDIAEQLARDLASGVVGEELRQKYLSRKHGLLTAAFERLMKLPGEGRREVGRHLNELRTRVEAASNVRLAEREVDLTVPPALPNAGSLHPMTVIERELTNIFRGLGFSTAHGFELESDWYNFTALNMPPLHPARDAQDTFYVQSAGQPLVMRTQTSPVQIRYMQTHEPPFSVISAGKVFRNEATDATHEHTFYQMEGLAVGPDVSFSTMAWTLDYVLKRFFGSDVTTRLQPAYFPFVEPGAEVAMSSPRFRDGRWVEILGCGAVHQNVFEAAGYRRGRYQGFAFGLGLSRFALMKYGIPDIRLLMENDVRFLKQF